MFACECAYWAALRMDSIPFQRREKNVFFFCVMTFVSESSEEIYNLRQCRSINISAIFKAFMHSSEYLHHSQDYFVLFLQHLDS
jgi:hypothetical protein